jgi:hypothetical protein
MKMIQEHGSFDTNICEA